MIRVNTEVIRDNGVVIKHLVITIISVVRDFIEITFDCFTSKELLDKALRRKELEKENLELFDKFQKLSEDDDISKEELDNLQRKINSLADEVDTLPTYEDIIYDSMSVTIPKTDDLSYEYIFSELEKNYGIKIIK